MLKKILVTGANGQVGKEIQLLSKNFPAIEFLFASRTELDITDKNSVEKYFMEHQPQCVINCAAYTAVDKAESEPDAALLVNATAVGYLASSCNHLGIPFIHISTDFVFDGTKNSPYNEMDETNPQGVYARTKREGEKLALHTHSKTIVVRTSWVYSEFGNNFVKTMIRLGKEKPELRVVNDQKGSPTYAKDLADTLLKIAMMCDALKHWGIYHFSNSGEITWCEFAKAILELKGIETPVHPITTAEFPTPAKRPAYSVMSKEKIQNTFGIKLRDWKESLSECLKQIE